MKIKEHGHMILPIILSAALSITVLSSCDRDAKDWDDSLPSAATTPSVPTVVYETEETTTTEPITVTTAEKTSRTAASSKEPELATTTETSSESTASSISVVPDVPKIPISEYTSTTAVRPSAQTSAPTVSSGTESSRTQTPAYSGTLTDSESSEITPTETTVDTVTSAVNRVNVVDMRPYSYNFMGERSLYIYDALITAIEQKKTSVSFSSVISFSSEDYCAVYERIYNDECSIFYIGTKMQYAVNSTTKRVASANIFYKYSEDEIRRMQEEIDEEVDKVLAMITPEMTEYDIVKLFYDYLALNVRYDDDEGENCSDIYGVFVEKKAICGGFARAFEYLCTKAGIDSMTITGDADNVPHMWNMVKLGGEWYHIDPTYAVSESKAGEFVRYDYFCVTDEVISRTRNVYVQDYKYPEATAETFNYYVRNGLVADSYDDVKEMLLNRIVAAAENREIVAELQCSNKETYETAVYDLFDRSRAQIVGIMENALSRTENKFRCDNISFSQDPATYVIKVFLEYTDQNGG